MIGNEVYAATEAVTANTISDTCGYFARPSYVSVVVRDGLNVFTCEIEVAVDLIKDAVDYTAVE